MCFNELNKNHQMSLSKDHGKSQIKYEQQGDPYCPAKSLKLFLEKLNPKCPLLFQKPKSDIVGVCPV